MLDNQEVLDELARLKRAGIVIGLTLSGANQAEVLRRARTYRPGWRAPVRLCAGHVEPARTFRWPGSGRGPGRRPGRDRQGGPGQRPADQPQHGRARFAVEGGTLRREAERLGVGLDALALAAALAQPWADVVLSGAVTMEQLRSNVRALDIGLDPAAMGALAGLAEDPVSYWQTRSTLKWN